MSHDVTIIILTYKSKNLTIDYIKNLYKKFKIIIVDNSKDTELETVIKNNYPDVDIHLISNNGYSTQINYGVNFVKTKYFLISNPDVRGINEIDIMRFLDVAERLDNKFSALGPRYIDVNPKSIKQSKNNEDIAELRFLSGACMFFYKKNYDLVGGFDNNIFLYFEENDYCQRSKKFFKNYQVNTIKVYHDIGNSVLSKNEQEVKDQRDLRSWHFVWSKFYYYKKNFGFFFAIFIFIPIIFRTGIKTFLYLISKDEINYLKYKNRWSGIISSIKGKRSFKRPKF
jgi:GT2 family glycosyltransferase